jgi:hypothetical protein
MLLHIFSPTNLYLPFCAFEKSIAQEHEQIHIISTSL